MTCIQQTIRYWWNKPKMTQIEGETYHVLGLKESMSWRWLYYPKNLQIQYNPYEITSGVFHRIRAKNFTICMETQTIPNSQSNLKKEKMKLGKLGSLISDYIIKLTKKFIM